MGGLNERHALKMLPVTCSGRDHAQCKIERSIGVCGVMQARSWQTRFLTPAEQTLVSFSIQLFFGGEGFETNVNKCQYGKKYILGDINMFNTVT